MNGFINEREIDDWWIINRLDREIDQGIRIGVGNSVRAVPDEGCRTVVIKIGNKAELAKIRYSNLLISDNIRGTQLELAVARWNNDSHHRQGQTRRT